MTLRHHIAVVLIIAAATCVAGCGRGSQGSIFAACGNGVLDPGEECDDGNLLDNDACLSTCVRARCGDGFVDLAHEACDGNDITSCPDPETHQPTKFCACADLGFAPGTVLCKASCTFDTSQCGPEFTPTPTVTGTPTLTVTPTGQRGTPTPTTTATPTPTSPCGNGFLEPGETCETCAADCVVKSCSVAGTIATFAVEFSSPPGQDVTGITVLVGYRSDRVSLPGSGPASSVATRVKNRPTNAIFAANDFDYALRAAMSRSSAFPSGSLFTIDFDTCSGVTPATADDFGCTVVGCANVFRSVEDCACVVTAP